MNMSRFSIESPTPPGHSGLTGASWEFVLLGNKLVVDRYTTWVKQTKRHKAQRQLHWSRLNSRESNLKFDDVPFTLEIAALAKQGLLTIIESTLVVEFQR